MRIMHEQKFHYRPLSLILYIPPSLSLYYAPLEEHVSALGAHLNASFFSWLQKFCVCVYFVLLCSSPLPLIYRPSLILTPSCSLYMLLNNGQLIWALSFFQ